MKFSNKLSFIIFTTGLTALIILSFAIFKLNYDSVIVSQSGFTQSIANEISDDMNYMLIEKIKTTLTLANCNTIIQALEESIASYTDLPDKKREESIKQLNEKWKSTKDPADNFILEFTDNKAAQFLKKQQTLLKDEYGEIFLTNKFGALVASTAKLSTFAHGHKYWWLGSYNNGKGAVFFDDRGYDDSVGGYVLGLVVPIKKDNQIIGILKCNLNILGSINKLILSATDNLIGEFKLTRSGGMVVLEEGFEPLSTQIHDDILKQLNNKAQGSIIIKDAKEKYLVGFSQIQLTKGEKGYGFGGTFESIDHKKGNKEESWYALCYRQISVIQAPIIESIKSFFLLGFAVILILMLVSYLFGKKIAQPLTMLNKATNKIGKGDFEYTIDISQNDEFGNLAHSFNRMTDKLQKTTTSIELLENEITERKKAEKALENSRNFLDRIINESPFAMWISDKKGTMIKCNIALKKSLNITDEQLIGKYNVFEDVVAIEQGLIPKIRTVFEDGKTANFSVEWDGDELGYKDAKTVHIEGTMFPIHDDKGGLTNVVNHWIDVTKRKQAEKEKIKTQQIIAEQNKLALIGQVAGKMAHDFNNILGIIMGNTELALFDCSDADTRKTLELIFDQTLRGKNLTKNLVTFAKDQELNQEFFRIGEKINLVLNLLKKDIEGIEVIKKDSSGVSELFADPGMIEHTMIILLQNSIHALSKAKAPKIIIRTYCLDDNICFEIEDNGCGIPENALDRIYEPAFTMKGSRDTTGSYKPGIKGTGYGMANVKKYIEQHKASISIDSKVGEGTKITITLPVIKKELTQKEIIEIKKENLSFEKYILLVEDEQAISDVQYKILTHEPCSHKVDVANDGQAAMDLFERNEYDLISLDYILPGGINGMDVYYHIRKTNKNIPILFISGNIEFLESIKGLKQKDDNIDHLSKPCRNKDYVKSINELLERNLASQE
jgi:PAS domain S-box-containing protein